MPFLKIQYFLLLLQMFIYSTLTLDPDENIQFHFYTQTPYGGERPVKTISPSEIIEQRLKLGDAFKIERPTRILAYGLQKNMESTPAKIYLQDRDYNVIVMDWFPCLRKFYAPVKRYRYEFAEQLAILIHSLMTLSKDVEGNLKRLSVIGFCLSAHVIGIAGKILKKAYNLELEVIIVINAASILFQKSDGQDGLSKESAKYVQAIHTSNRISKTQPFTHADFHVFAGEHQLGCPPSHGLDFCSHSRGLKLFFESIELFKNGYKKFPSIKCQSYDDMKQMKKRTHKGNPYVDSEGRYNYMGGDIDGNTKHKPYGIFYLETNPRFPYDERFKLAPNGVSLDNV